MMESPAHAASMHDSNNYHNNNYHNNLTNIRGIGTARKQWFNSLGIYTIADLAHASADEIESQFKNNGRSLSRSELNEWMAQAQAQLADLTLPSTISLHHNEDAVDVYDTNLLPIVAPEIAPEITPEISPEITPEVALETDVEDPANQWNSIALFKVDYQTRYIQGKSEQRTVIHHLDTGAVEYQPNFDTHLIQEWIRNQVGATSSQSKTEISDRPEITPEITQLRVIPDHQPETAMTVDKHYPIFSGAIQANEPFALEILTQFAGLIDAPLLEQMAYRVQCIAHDLSTGLTVTLAELTAYVSISNDTVYKVLLPDLILPSPSIYRLKVWGTLQNVSTASSYFKVPMLQVV